MKIGERNIIQKGTITSCFDESDNQGDLSIRSTVRVTIRDTGIWKWATLNVCYFPNVTFNDNSISKLNETFSIHYTIIYNILSFCCHLKRKRRYDSPQSIRRNRHKNSAKKALQIFLCDYSTALLLLSFYSYICNIMYREITNDLY